MKVSGLTCHGVADGVGAGARVFGLVIQSTIKQAALKLSHQHSPSLREWVEAASGNA